MSTTSLTYLLFRNTLILGAFLPFATMASCHSFMSLFIKSDNTMQNKERVFSFYQKSRTERYHYLGEEKYYQSMDSSLFKSSYVKGVDQYRFLPIERIKMTIADGKLVRTPRNIEELPRIVPLYLDDSIITFNKMLFYIDRETAENPTPSKNFFRAIAYRDLIVEQLPLQAEKMSISTNPHPYLANLESPSLLESNDWMNVFIKHKDALGGYDPNSEDLIPMEGEIEYIKQLVHNGTELIKRLDREVQEGKFEDYLMSLHTTLMSNDYAGYYRGAKHENTKETMIYLKSINRSMTLQTPQTISTLHLPKVYSITLPKKLGMLVNRHSDGMSFIHKFIKVEKHAKVLSVLEDMFTKLTKKKMNDSDYLMELSDFYHIGANAHLFARGNNSLFMGMVNYFLMKRGMNPVTHGELDYLAMLYSHDEFRWIFISHLAESNPSIKKGLNTKIESYKDFLGMIP